MTGLSYGVGFLLGAGMVALVFSAAALAAARSSVEDLAAKDFLVVAAPAAIISGLWVVAILYCCRHFPFGAAFLFGAGLVNLVALLFCIPYFLDREERFYWKTEFLGWMWILANFGPAVPAGLWMVCALFLYHRFAWSGVAGLVGVSCLILLVARLCRPQRPGLLDAVESGDMKVVQAVFDRGGVSAQADEAALC